MRFARNYPAQRHFTFPLASGNKTLHLDFERYVRCGDPEKGINRLKALNQGKELAIESNGRLLIVSADSFETLGEYEIRQSSKQFIYAALSHLTVSRNSRVVCFKEEGHPNDVYVWNLATETQPKILITINYPIECIAVSPDGKYLAIAEAFDNNKYPKNIDHTVSNINYEQFFSINIYDTKSGSLIAECQQHIGEITRLLYSDNGKILVSAGNDESIRVWDALTNELVQTIGNPLTISQRLIKRRVDPFNHNWINATQFARRIFLISHDLKYLVAPIQTNSSTIETHIYKNSTSPSGIVKPFFEELEVNGPEYFHPLCENGYEFSNTGVIACKNGTEIKIVSFPKLRELANFRPGGHDMYHTALDVSHDRMYIAGVPFPGSVGNGGIFSISSNYKAAQFESGVLVWKFETK